MKTEKAIEIIKKLYDSDLNFLGSHFVTIEEYKKLLKERNEVLEIIQCGEENGKYKQMWENLKWIFKVPIASINGKFVLKGIKKLEQKYFPK